MDKEYGLILAQVRIGRAKEARQQVENASFIVCKVENYIKGER